MTMMMMMMMMIMMITIIFFLSILTWTNMMPGEKYYKCKRGPDSQMVPKPSSHTKPVKILYKCQPTPFRSTLQLLASAKTVKGSNRGNVIEKHV